MLSCKSCLVRNRAICGALTNDELAALNSIGRTRVLKAGEPLMWEGADSLVVANVVEGVLKVSKSLDDGREQIVGILCPADFIGRPFSEVSHQSVVALSDARICVFARGAFETFSRSHPHLQTKILERTYSELDLARHWMLLLSRKSASERVATFIIEMSQRLADHGCAGGKGPINDLRLPFGRRQIADILGMTIETVSRQLTTLKARGLIALPRRDTIAILDRTTLANLAESRAS
jgi:CRP/FNR family transcriptional regulator